MNMILCIITICVLAGLMLLNRIDDSLERIESYIFEENYSRDIDVEEKESVLP